ncbi:MAG: AAA family ATPase, partial [Dehalococcoidia bacterium]
MIIESIRVQNFLSHQDSKVDLTEAPRGLIYGENGAGKSALFDAVEYALYSHHRGKRQHAGLLVKQGAKRAIVQVVVELEGSRYRITRHIDASENNLEWLLEEEAGATGDWKPKNVGNGLQATSRWLESRLPKHDLFRSAIFLRQNDVAHFLSGSAADRMEWFATLLDLSVYTKLSKQAKRRSDAAERERRDAEVRLHDQGEVSDAALVCLQEERTTVADALSRVSLALQAATMRLRGAREWERLQEERSSAEKERERLEALLADQPTILSDHERVSAWDRDAEQLRSYWGERDRAIELRSEAYRARQRKSQAEVDGAKHHAELDALEERLRDLEEVRLPDARLQELDLRKRQQRLEQEARIAASRSDMAVAQRLVLALVGKDDALAQWNARKQAIAPLSQLVDARRKAEEASLELVSAQDDFQEVELQVQVLDQQLAKVQEDKDRAHTEVESASEAVRTLREQAALLRGRIESHAGLEGREPECPVCARPLDSSAHVHVQQVLTDERARLTTLQAELKQADTAERAAKGKVKGLNQDLDQTGKRCTQAHQGMAHARQRVDYAARQLPDAERDLTTARTLVQVEHAFYAPVIDTVTDEWLATERGRVLGGVKSAQKDAEAYTSAKEQFLRAETELQTLQGQRAEGSEPLGDERLIEEVRALVEAAITSLGEQQLKIEVLEAEVRKTRKRVGILTAEVAKYQEQERTAEGQVDDLSQRASRADSIAEGLRGILSHTWKAVLASHDCYDAERAEVEERRASAVRLTELAQAHGRLEGVREQLGKNQESLAQITMDHRIPVSEAAAYEVKVRDEERDVRRTEGEVDRRVADLEERRTRALAYRRNLDTAAQEMEVYGLLADLLGEGGAIQTEVAEQEQRRIVEQVNLVLDRLDDPLCMRLGDARRARGVKLQDLLILDRSDPSATPRYFDFLSGGEQFRIALALALALHFGVGKGTVGTIIVDEGFGALDQHRRDALAQQMADMGQGILSLGLAKSIIICSHSSEVQRHFAN